MLNKRLEEKPWTILKQIQVGNSKKSIWMEKIAKEQRNFFDGNDELQGKLNRERKENYPFSEESVESGGSESKLKERGALIRPAVSSPSQSRKPQIGVQKNNGKP